MNPYKEAVHAFCLKCKDGDEFAVGACAASSCPLHAVRPNRGMKFSREQLEEDSAQFVADQLTFGGLKTLVERRK